MSSQDGMIKPQSLAHLRSVIKKRPYDHKTTHSEIMFEEGKQFVLQYIEDKMVEGQGYRLL